MANSKQATKRVHQATKRNERNKAQKTLLKTCIKSFLTTVSTGNKESIMTAFKGLQKQIDQFASKGIITGNTASRKKSRLNKLVRKAA